MGSVQEAENEQPRFSIARSFKLGSFHIGSSMTDLISSAVWNRVLISDLGVAAGPVAALAALRYLLAPLTLWAGFQSDTRPIFGARRIPYIWFGRLLMLLSLPLTPLSTVAIAQNTSSPLGWSLAIAAAILYGVGTLISGAPFLALVHDSAPYERRGQAVSIVQFMLVVSFAFVPAIYAVVMPHYDQAIFWRLVLIAMGGAAFFWIISIWGEERSHAPPTVATPPATPAQPVDLRVTFKQMWLDRRTRRYAIFVAVSAFFAFMQDAMLEPFGGDVFGLSAGQTTRFNSYWGVGVLVGMIGTYIWTRHYRPDQQAGVTAWGLVGLALPLILLGLASALMLQALVMPILVVFGLGFGIFTVGGVSLLMAMSAEDRAGSYLALWSVIQLVAKGGGIATGGVIRDLGFAISGQLSMAYAAVFTIEAGGLLLAVWLLRRVDIAGYAEEHRRRTTDDMPLPEIS